MKMTEITSASNSVYKKWLELQSSKGIKNQNQFFLMGEKLIEEFIREKKTNFQIHSLVISFSDFEERRFDNLVSWAQKNSISIYKVSNTLFKEIDFLGTHAPLILLNFTNDIFENATEISMIPSQGLQVVCPLGDPTNLGSLARTALAFGANALILTSESAHPFHPKAIKSSAGALLKIKIKKSGSLKEWTEINIKTPVFALDMNGTSITKAPWPKDLFLLVGEEGSGIPKGTHLKTFSIPMNQSESLNATVATSIAMWEWKKTWA